MKIIVTESIARDFARATNLIGDEEETYPRLVEGITELFERYGGPPRRPLHTVLMVKTTRVIDYGNAISEDTYNIDDKTFETLAKRLENDVLTFCKQLEKRHKITLFKTINVTNEHGETIEKETLDRKTFLEARRHLGVKRYNIKWALQTASNNRHLDSLIHGNENYREALARKRDLY